MKNKFGSNAKDIMAIFGPCALGCCYEVGKDIISFVKPLKYFENVIKKREGKYFFDLSKFLFYQLEDSGIITTNFSFCKCTICSEIFCSHRNGDKCRNVTVASLHS